jgi:hypothetical protein
MSSNNMPSPTRSADENIDPTGTDPISVEGVLVLITVDQNTLARLEPRKGTANVGIQSPGGNTIIKNQHDVGVFGDVIGRFEALLEKHVKSFDERIKDLEKDVKDLKKHNKDLEKDVKSLEAYKTHSNERIIASNQRIQELEKYKTISYARHEKSDKMIEYWKREFQETHPGTPITRVEASRPQP